MLAFSLCASEFVPECSGGTIPMVWSKAATQEKLNGEEVGAGVEGGEASREAGYGRDRVRP